MPVYLSSWIFPQSFYVKLVENFTVFYVMSLKDVICLMFSNFFSCYSCSSIMKVPLARSKLCATSSNLKHKNKKDKIKGDTEILFFKEASLFPKTWERQNVITFRWGEKSHSNRLSLVPQKHFNIEPKILARVLKTCIASSSIIILVIHPKGLRVIN